MFVASRRAFVPFFAAVLCATAAATVTAADAGVQVTVLDAKSEPMPGVTVLLVEGSREQVSGPDGVARFDGVPPGRYHVVARLEGFTSARAEIEVGATPMAVTVTLAGQPHFSESITVSPSGRDTFESYQPAEILAAEELNRNLGPSLGETLAWQTGVNARSFGPGPARPVIRGLDGDRVLVLENGSRTGDLSSQSADHGVNLDPASANRIEVVRGPATLLYGSNAFGGVVNVLSEDIPTRAIEGVHGAFLGQGATANEEAGLGGNLSYGNGRFAVRAGGSGHRTDDVDTPEGTLPNSQSELKSGTVGAAFTGTNGYAGVSYQYVDSTYGVPFVEEGETTLNPRRHAFDFRAERRALGGVFDGIKLSGAYRDYRHDEIEGDGTVATSFHNRFGEGQVMLNHRPLGRLKGTIGFWGSHRSYTSQGEEALAPPTKQGAVAAFLYEEITFHHLTLQFGARVDHTRFSPDGALVDRPELVDRAFTAGSGSVGVLAFLRDDLTLAVNLARVTRNPSLEELYNNGPHAGNFAFEVGNPDLPLEKGLGLDVSLRYRSQRVSGEATIFRNSIDDFIFAFPTGEEEDGLPVVNFLSADSLLQGFELHGDVALPGGLSLEVGGDAVRGTLRSSDEDLPRMPPLRGWVGLGWERGGFHAEAEVRAAAKQDRVFGAETATPGYTVVNGHASYKFTTGRTAHIVTLRLDNAGDRLYRSHLSYIKDLAPEMGRSLKLVYSLRF